MSDCDRNYHAPHRIATVTILHRQFTRTNYYLVSWQMRDMHSSVVPCLLRTFTLTLCGHTLFPFEPQLVFHSILEGQAVKHLSPSSFLIMSVVRMPQL